MGRIKTKAVKRIAKSIYDMDSELVEKDFESNKKMLGNEMESKKIRNIVAGYLTRLKKINKKIIEQNE